MAVTTCCVDGLDYSLEYQHDLSDNTHSGILHLQSPVLFSYSDSLFIPEIDTVLQQTIRNSIIAHKQGISPVNESV
jgi:hypothetical protein